MLRRALVALLFVVLLGPQAVATVASEELQATVLAAKRKVYPALVHIQPVLEVYRAGERERMAVTGSGVIISEEGYVLTNNHVVQHAERVICTLHDQQEVTAELVGRDVFTDLAVIRLNLDEVEGRVDLALGSENGGLELLGRHRGQGLRPQEGDEQQGDQGPMGYG